MMLTRSQTASTSPQAGQWVYYYPGLVDTVLVAGRVVKRDGVLVGVDLAALTEGFFTGRRREGRAVACAAIFFFIA